jgi:hypothetical protein
MELKSWETNKEKIVYPKGKTWQDYVRDTRLEISCGEAPYITSRYDTYNRRVYYQLKIELEF